MESKNCLKFKTVATGEDGGHGRGWNLSIKYIAENFPLPDGRGLVVCWPARRYVNHFNIGKRLCGFIALVSIPEYIRRWLLRLGLRKVRVGWERPSRVDGQGVWF